MKYFIRTFGCQMNVADSDFFGNCLRNYGFIPTENINDADIIIVNTCTVRQHAEDRALSYIGKLKTLKNKNHNLIIIVAGCVAERLKFLLKKIFPYIDLLISAKEVEKFEHMIKQYVNYNLDQQSNSYECNKQISAFVPISRGCNNFCSYCIVPYVRGVEKSISPEKIIDEIQCYVKRGVKEIILLGQNVNSYHYLNSNSKIVDFSDLLKEINKIEGLERIRFITNHPKDMSDKIINTISELEKVCEHIHLPLQSGSNRILELMNRKYTAERYLELVNNIRKKIPNISITSDVMVGFPTETEQDFYDTIEMVIKSKFDFCYVFKYSAREKTKIFQLGDTVSEQEKDKRHKKLLELCNNLAIEKNKSFVGKKVEVLVEKIYNNNVYFGKTRDNHPVTIQYDPEIVLSEKESLIGELITVKIVDYKIHTLIGTLC